MQKDFDIKLRRYGADAEPTASPSSMYNNKIILCDSTKS